MSSPFARSRALVICLVSATTAYLKGQCKQRAVCFWLKVPNDTIGKIQRQEQEVTGASVLRNQRAPNAPAWLSFSFLFSPGSQCIVGAWRGTHIYSGSSRLNGAKADTWHKVTTSLQLQQRLGKLMTCSMLSDPAFRTLSCIGLGYSPACQFYHLQHIRGCDVRCLKLQRQNELVCVELGTALRVKE